MAQQNPRDTRADEIHNSRNVEGQKTRRSDGLAFNFWGSAESRFASRQRLLQRGDDAREIDRKQQQVERVYAHQINPAVAIEPQVQTIQKEVRYRREWQKIVRIPHIEREQQKDQQAKTGDSRGDEIVNPQKSLLPRRPVGFR